MGEYAEDRLRQERRVPGTTRAEPIVTDLGTFKIGAERFTATSSGVLHYLPKGTSRVRGAIRISRAVGSRAFLRGYPQVLAEKPCGIDEALERATQWLSWVGGEH